MNEQKSTRTSPDVQPPNRSNNLQHVSISTMALIVEAARKSFDAATLRSLSVAFERLADEKDGGL